MKRPFLAVSFVASVALASDPHAAPPPAAPPAHAPTNHDVGATAAVSPDDAFQKLLDGNDRYRYGESTFPRFDASRRSDTFANGQHPFAAILGCADSRMPVEAIFDQGVGDLFVVRVAGNVADDDEIGTLEYGVAHLHTPLIVVLGHTKCGAVTAVTSGDPIGGKVGKLVDNIRPAVADVKAREPEAAGNRLIRLSIRANVLQSMHDILTGSETIAGAVKSQKVRIVGGVYDLQTGAIEWIGPHPRQQELLAKTPAATVHTDTSHDSHSAPTNDHTDHGDGHDKPAAHDPHGDANHDAHGKPATPGPHSSATPRKENWIALGGLLTGSMLASGATIHFMYGRKG